MSSVMNDGSFGSASRQRIFVWIVFVIAGLYTTRLAYMQIIQGSDFRLKAEAQAIKQVKIEPFRGNMIDRNGRFLVRNAPGFSVTVTPYEFTSASARNLARILGVDTTTLMSEVATAARYNKFAATKLQSGRDVDFAVISAIEEQRDSLPGVDVIIDPKRLYAFDGNASHLLGYTREVSTQQLAQFGDLYSMGDITGQTGIERAYEAFIRGQKGYSFVAVNKTGQRVSAFNDGKSDVRALEGDDLYLGLDGGLQELAEKLLDGKLGGVVALDPSNGEILAYASKPDFDLRQFTGKALRKYFNQLYTDPAKPLYNRVSMPIYPPGSTWKMLMALAGLQEGVITKTSTFYCSGAFHYGNRSCACHGTHGNIAVEAAIQHSCNSYFNQLALKLGIDRFHQYGSMFGFGRRTGVDLIEEQPGILASRAFMDRRYGKNGWNQYRLVNLGIGQGEIGVTPLQMAVYTAALANGGTLYQPHAVRAVYSKSRRKRERVPIVHRSIAVDPQYFDIVRNGMRLVVQAGTARGAAVPGIDVCGKTGTAQNPHGQDHSWFVCYAPANNPTIALCVMVENGGFGATTAVPMAQKMLNYFFNKTWPTDLRRDSTWLRESTRPVERDSAAPTPPADSVPPTDGPFGRPVATAPQRVPAPVRRSVATAMP